MAARVIHFGADECHRIMVLRSVGYSVDSCISLPQLRAELSTDGGAAAVCIAEDLVHPPQVAASVARSCTPAPLVLFRCSNRDCEETPFDLVVDSLAPPQKWLNEIQELIARCEGLRAQSREICKDAAQLCKESQAARQKSHEERERAMLERVRNAGHPHYGFGEPEAPHK